MTEGKDWLLEEEDPLDAALEEDAGMSVEERLARDEAAADESTDETESENAETDDTGADAVLNWAENTAAAKEASEAAWQAQWAEAERMLPGYVEPRPAAETALERAAVEVGRMNDRDRDDLLNSMRAANEKLAASYRAGTEGFDSAGEPVEPPFDPGSLDSAAFNEFMRAVAAGGASADPRRIPQGETYTSWSAKINSALGR